MDEGPPDGVRLRAGSTQGEIAEAIRLARLLRVGCVRRREDAYGQCDDQGGGPAKSWTPEKGEVAEFLAFSQSCRTHYLPGSGNSSVRHFDQYSIGSLVVGLVISAGRSRRTSHPATSRLNLPLRPASHVTVELTHDAMIQRFDLRRVSRGLVVFL